MAPKLLSDEQLTARVNLLLAAAQADALQLVDEEGRPVQLLDTWDAPTWAHLRDAQDGQVYVQPLRGSKELVQERYLQLLGLDV